MRRFVFLFLAGYFVSACLLLVVASLLSLKSAAILGIAPLLAGAFFSAHFFVKRNARLPSSAEATSFAWQSLVSVTVLSAAMVAVSGDLNALSSLKSLGRLFQAGVLGAFLIMAIIVMIAISYFAVRWAFTWYTKQALADKQRKIHKDGGSRVGSGSSVGSISALNAPPRWVRTSLTVSAVWAAIIIGLAVKTIVQTPSFEIVAAEPCPQLLPRLAESVERNLQSMNSRLFVKFFIWQDAKTGTELSPYRKGEQALNCDTLERRARLFALGAQAGVIEPQVYPRKGVLGLLIVLPMFAFALIAYLFHRPWSTR